MFIHVVYRENKQELNTAKINIWTLRSISGYQRGGEMKTGKSGQRRQLYGKGQS